MRASRTLTIKQCLADAQQKLQSPNSESQQDAAKLEAEVLLAFVLEKPRSHLYTWPEQEIHFKHSERYNRLVKRRFSGEPIAYITGEREFWGLRLKVSPDTLIPRPETERLVEIALEYIPPQSAFRIADLGTGTGAIALALASERPNTLIVATDISDAALSVARRNQAEFGLSNVQFFQGNWFEALNRYQDSAKRFDFILSNPPYVAEQDPHLQQGDLRFEPVQALSSGKNGLQDIKTIILEATRFLADGAYLLIEHGYDQADDVIDLFDKSGYSDVKCFRDYGERERATIGRWKTLEYSN